MIRNPNPAVRAGSKVPDSHDTIAPGGSPYIPSLDGIRAISFFLVFFSHAGLGATLVPGGFGVTVFFLLSGFLITTLLRLEFERFGRISLRAFYLRRVLRILPPLYVVLACAIVLFLMVQGWSKFPLGGTLSQALQYSNYYQIFAQPAVTIPGSGVLWSLAVEEHFYLLFPILYVWICPRMSAGRQALLLAVMCALALFWRLVLELHWGAGTTRTFYGTDTRFDSILFGCIFAIVASPVRRDPLHELILARMSWLLPVCLFVLLTTFLIRDDRFRETFRYSLQGIALVPIFIAAIHYQRSLPVRLLNLPVVRYLGVISYSLYLCHHIIIEYIRRMWPAGPFARGAVALVCALALSVAIYHFIERPCARLRKQLSKSFA